jgi:hypothetical protein
MVGGYKWLEIQTLSAFVKFSSKSQASCGAVVYLYLAYSPDGGSTPNQEHGKGIEPLYTYTRRFYPLVRVS